MAKKKVEFSEFKAYLISMLGMMYVLGAQGNKFVSLLNKLCAMEKNDCELVQNVLTLLQKKLDAGVNINSLLAFDCSGLGMKWLMEQNIFKYDMTAKDMYNSIPNKVKSLNAVKEGDFVFTNSLGHVGYYIGDNMVIEARGTAYGVVMTDLYKREWEKIARPDWWEGVEPVPPKPEKPVLKRELYFKKDADGKIEIRGEDVKDAQLLLTDKGYNPGVADGIFGNNTKIATMKFQHDNNLDADGVIGKITGTALGFRWEG